MLLGTVTVNDKVEKHDRNVRIMIMPVRQGIGQGRRSMGADVQIRAFRQVACLKDGVPYPSPMERSYMVQRQLSGIASDTVTLSDGTVLTAAQVAEALERFTDKYAQEDNTDK